ncbi:hypothetical protein FACS1894190_06100 [Spirochaetia bacterium]|nr:hypothetical protein FACS1894190_06100 [Spirochaetia bacterium]
MDAPLVAVARVMVVPLATTPGAMPAVGAATVGISLLPLPLGLVHPMDRTTSITSIITKKDLILFTEFLKELFFLIAIIFSLR